MKRINYYAAPEPWKVPKWVGITLGTIFATVAVMALALIVQLTRPAHAEAPAAMAAPFAPTPVVTELRVPTAPTRAAASSRAKHLKAIKKAKRLKSVASEKAKSSRILARHDSRDKRKQREDLDRTLGR